MSKKNREKRTELKFLKCSNCHKTVEVDGRCENVLCEDCAAVKYMRIKIVKNMDEFYEEQSNDLKGGQKNMAEKKVATKKVSPKAPAKEKAAKPAKADKAEKKPKFGPEVEEKVIKLFKEGKGYSEISKEMGGSPAVPKIKRIITAAGLLK